MMKNKTNRPKAGWTIGGIGGLSWMPLLGMLLLVKGDYWAAAAAFLFFLIGILYLFIFAPWKHPRVSLGLLYAGFPVIILLAGALLFLLWYPWQNKTQEFSWYLLVPIFVPVSLALFIPVLTLAGKNWENIHGQKPPHGGSAGQ